MSLKNNSDLLLSGILIILGIIPINDIVLTMIISEISNRVHELSGDHTGCKQTLKLSKLNWTGKQMVNTICQTRISGELTFSFTPK